MYLTFKYISQGFILSLPYGIMLLNLIRILRSYWPAEAWSTDKENRWLPFIWPAPAFVLYFEEAVKAYSFYSLGKKLKIRKLKYNVNRNGKKGSDFTRNAKMYRKKIPASPTICWNAYSIRQRESDTKPMEFIQTGSRKWISVHWYIYLLHWDQEFIMQRDTMRQVKKERKYSGLKNINHQSWVCRTASEVITCIRRELSLLW